ncbi:MAG: inositol monophosphatase family protein [Acidiferrobacteraceae bacterium]
MHPMLNIAVKAARQAGKLLLRYSGQLGNLTVETKGRNDFVTAADRDAEYVIMKTIRAAYPNHAILAEESGLHAGNEYEWIIDPLDGTTNFVHGYPQFAVSIALRHRGQLDQAVVYDPLRDEIFTASRGGGAHLNDRRIRVSQSNSLSSSLLGTGFPFKSMEYLETWIGTFRAILPRTHGIRRAGSAALDLAHVASGRLDGFWEIGLGAWDIAAGSLLVIEAGGMVSDFAGGQDFLATGNVIAGNPKIHGEITHLIGPLLPPELHC